MDDVRGNIDLIFRNGLKDFEVLPPPGVWDNIRPTIHKENKLIHYYKAAAVIALLVSMSFIAYRWGMEVSADKLTVAMEGYQEPVFMSAHEPFDILKPELITDNALTLSKKENQFNIPVIIRTEPVVEINSDNSSKNITDMLVADNETLPGIQDPFEIKYASVKVPSFQPLTYDLLQENMKVPDMPRWSISALASPTYNSQFTSSSNQFAQNVIQSDKARASYTGGLGLSYRITGRFTIQSGIYYSAIGQELGGMTAYSGYQVIDNSKGDHNFEVVTANGTVYSNNPDIFLQSDNLPERVQATSNNSIDPVKANLKYVSSDIYQDLTFLEMPLILRYKLIDKKIDLNLIGGVSYNFLVNNSVYTFDNGSRYPVGNTQMLNNVSLSSSVGMGMEYNISRSFSFNVEPTFRYYLNPINSGGTSVFHPYSIGVLSGLSYRF